jgi:chromosome segregation ATPase
MDSAQQLITGQLNKLSAGQEEVKTDITTVSSGKEKMIDELKTDICAVSYELKTDILAVQEEVSAMEDEINADQAELEQILKDKLDKQQTRNLREDLSRNIEATRKDVEATRRDLETTRHDREATRRDHGRGIPNKARWWWQLGDKSGQGQAA